MTIYEIILLAIAEIIGDFGFEQYSNHGGVNSFAIGTIGYIGVIIMLIISLQGSTILLVNGAWDGISALIESIAAYIILGERFTDFYQYIGLVFIIVGLFLLKIPSKREKPFKIPNW
jgi:multidrug transporter EmrE-like cation transporter